MRSFDGITDLMDTSLSRLWELVINREAWSPALLEVAESDMTELLNWTYVRVFVCACVLFSHINFLTYLYMYMVCVCVHVFMLYVLHIYAFYSSLCLVMDIKISKCGSTIKILD